MEKYTEGFCSEEEVHWSEKCTLSLCENKRAEGKVICQAHIDEFLDPNFGSTEECLKSMTAELALHKRALDILGKRVKGCPKIEKANSCNEWASGRACPQCRIDAAINEAKEKETP